MSAEAARLAAVISPLRRALLQSARAQEQLPDIPDAQIEIIRALPRGTVGSPGGLAAQLGRNRSTVSNLLAAMERAGLVVRRGDANDRRQVEVMATPAALDWFDRYDRAASGIVQRAMDGLAEERARMLASAIPVLEDLSSILLDHASAHSAEEAS